MRDAGDDDVLEVREDLVERFGILRRALGKRCGYLTRLNA